MKSIHALAAALALILIPSALGAEKVPIPMTVGCVNLAGEEYDFLKARGREKLSVIIARIPGLVVVEGAPGEQQFTMPSQPGIDPLEVVRIGNLTGAKFLALATVMNVGRTARHYQGDEMSVVNLVFTMRVSLKLYDTVGGSAFYADEEGVEKLIRELPGRIIETDDISSQLLLEALESLGRRMASVRYPQQEKRRLVTVEVSSTPAGADIEIDGLFRGHTPAKIPLSEGIHRIRLNLALHQPWEQSFSAAEGLGINPRLEPRAEASPPK